MYETYAVKFILRNPEGFIETKVQEIQIFYDMKDGHQDAEDAIKVLYKERLVRVINVTYI